MRSLWTGAIGFGLVNIPVKLFSATQQSDLDLDMLDKKDHSNIRFKRVNEKTGKEVPWANIVRAYNYEGNYVVLDDEDFKKASPEKTKMIEIAEFVEEKEVDSIYYETPYYLEPAKGGEKAYVLLRDALKKTGKTGLSTFVMRTKESLGLIKPSGNILLLQKIRYAEEIRATEEIKIPDNAPKPAEIKMAISLIDQLTGKFDISKFKDTYSSELMKMIEAKAKGKKLPAPTMKVVHSTSKDLMEQLKASLETKRKKAS
jgi:DNA end-binding protein Ku